MISKQQAADLVLEAKERNDLTWEAIAAELGTPLVWTVSALLGMHPVPVETAAAAIELLGLDAGAQAALERQPTRVADPTLLSDPTIYRFHEALGVYGPAIKALIHEQCGDGIMSAINFSVSVDSEDVGDERRIRVLFDGKYLPYQWT